MNSHPIDFYSWGNMDSDVSLISKSQQITEKAEETLSSITISEDETTPELDYVLKVNGKEQGKIVIPESEDVNPIPDQDIENLFGK